MCAQRGKIKKNPWNKDTGIYGKIEGHGEKREKNQKNENGLGVKRSVKRDLLHYLSFAVRLS